jgi:hypothetical protein
MQPLVVLLSITSQLLESTAKEMRVWPAEVDLARCKVLFFACLDPDPDDALELLLVEGNPV